MRKNNFSRVGRSPLLLLGILAGLSSAPALAKRQEPAPERVCADFLVTVEMATTRIERAAVIANLFGNDYEILRSNLFFDAIITEIARIHVSGHDQTYGNPVEGLQAVLENYRIDRVRYRDETLKISGLVYARVRNDFLSGTATEAIAKYNTTEPRYWAVHKLFKIIQSNEKMAQSFIDVIDNVMFHANEHLANLVRAKGQSSTVKSWAAVMPINPLTYCYLGSCAYSVARRNVIVNRALKKTIITGEGLEYLNELSESGALKELRLAKQPLGFSELLSAFQAPAEGFPSSAGLTLETDVSARNALHELTLLGMNTQDKFLNPRVWESFVKFLLENIKSSRMDRELVFQRISAVQKHIEEYRTSLNNQLLTAATADDFYQKLSRATATQVDALPEAKTALERIQQKEIRDIQSKTQTKMSEISVMLTSLDQWEGRAERIGAAVKKLETAVKAGSSNLTLPLLKEQVF
ncbi:MAG: hypothetical protein H7301_11245, partial [Cryobacterium sp.]|nr:hypothetical protein [Oligoflexia bacterium]